MNTTELPENAFYLGSYPRSGNTWMLYSLTMLFSAIQSEARGSVNQCLPYVYGSIGDNSFYLRAENEIDMSRPLIIKTHETYDEVKRLYPPKKSIYIYRDGRDVLLSFYFYTKAFSEPKEIIFERIGTNRDVTVTTKKPVAFNSLEFAEFIRAHGPEWVRHVRSWLKAERVFFLRYEDLHRDFTKKMEEIVDYLSIKPCVKISEVRDIYVKEYRTYLTDNNQNFFRKGIIGDWKNYFSEEHSLLFSEVAGDLLIELGYERKPGYAPLGFLRNVISKCFGTS